MNQRAEGTPPAARREDLVQLRRALDVNGHHLRERRDWLLPLLHNTLQGRLVESPTLAWQIQRAAKREPTAWFQLLCRPPEYRSALLRVLPQVALRHHELLLATITERDLAKARQTAEDGMRQTEADLKREARQSLKSKPARQR